MRLQAPGTSCSTSQGARQLVAEARRRGVVLRLDGRVQLLLQAGQRARPMRGAAH